jgi:uncharacterized protein (TIGR02246 family)
MLETDVDRLLARLDELESAKAIEDLHRTFTRTVADREFDKLAGFFCEDGAIDMRRHGLKVGREAIAQHFAGMAAQPLHGAAYVLSSPVIEVEGDAARGVWSWHRFSAQGDWQEGRYRCRYRRDDDVWRFAHMHFRVVLPQHDDAPDTTEPTS